MTSVFSWQNSISLCSASFYTPRPNLPVTPGTSFFPQVSLDFQLLHSNLLWRKGLLLFLCGVSSGRSYRYSLYVYMFLTQQSQKAMAPHSSILVWKIPWTEEPGRLQSMESLRVGQDWATSLSRIGEGNGNPLQCSCLESPRVRGAWWAAIYGVAQSRTWLKRLSSSSSMWVNKGSLWM